MANRYDYTVVVQGNDWDEDNGWHDEHYHVCDIPMDGEKEAIEYLHSITKEQALEWERQSKCNGLDIVVFADEINEYGVPTYEVSIVAECEWIGDKLNGIWV